MFKLKLCRLVMVKSLPNNKIRDMLKLNAFAENKFTVVQMVKIIKTPYKQTNRFQSLLSADV